MSSRVPYITVSLHADTPSQLSGLVAELHQALNAGRIVQADDASLTLATNAVAAAEDGEPEPKRKRGRPRKNPEPETTPADAAATDDVTGDTAEELPAAEEPKAEAAAPEGAVADLSPAEAREQALKKVQAHFAANPGCLEDLRKMSAKYGVKKLADVPDDRAKELLADVLLLVSGGVEV